MKRIRLLAVAFVLSCALPLMAQESATGAPPTHMPSVGDHVKVLSEKLALTADQQEKARPIIAEMQDSLQKVMDDQSLTEEQKHEQMHSAFMKADKELRVFLTDEQKAKLDEIERPHSEMHAK